MHDPKFVAIMLTVIGINSGRDYYHSGVEIYMLQAADGTDFIVKDDNGNGKQVFSDAYKAAEMFANIIWRNKK